jgi:hypothetical protein
MRGPTGGNRAEEEVKEVDEVKEVKERNSIAFEGLK